MSACPIKHPEFSFKDSALSEYAIDLNEKLYKEQLIFFKNTLWVIL
jgi:hypothetical protein